MPRRIAVALAAAVAVVLAGPSVASAQTNPGMSDPGAKCGMTKGWHVTASGEGGTSDQDCADARRITRLAKAYRNRRGIVVSYGDPELSWPEPGAYVEAECDKVTFRARAPFPRRLWTTITCEATIGPELFVISFVRGRRP